MADPLGNGKGIPARTVRDRARAWGTKVPSKPQLSGYCAIHGMVHDGPCNPAKPDVDAEEVSRSGGSSKLPGMKPPFKLGG